MGVVALDALLVGVHIAEVAVCTFPLGAEETVAVELHAAVVYLVTPHTAGAGELALAEQALVLMLIDLYCGENHRRRVVYLHFLYGLRRSLHGLVMWKNRKSNGLRHTSRIVRD